MFLQPFIGCWLGKHYQLDNIIIYLLIFCLFIRYQSAAVYIYLGSAGLFSDVWAAWTELIINLSVTILLAPTYGIIGILLGKIISYFFISVLWKPYYLFSQGFHKSVSIYWRGMAPYYIIFASFTVLSVWIKYAIINQYVDSVLSLVLYGAVISLPLLGLYFIFLFSFTTGMKFFIARKPAIYNILIHITFLQKWKLFQSGSLISTRFLQRDSEIFILWFFPTMPIKNIMIIIHHDFKNILKSLKKRLMTITSFIEIFVHSPTKEL